MVIEYLGKCVKVLFRTLFVVILCGVCFLAGVGATFYVKDKEARTDMANLVLHDLSSSLELAGLVNGSNLDLAAIKLQQNKNIVELILTVSALRPEVSKLDSISLESLCKTIQLENDGLLEDPKIGEIRILAKGYLDEVNGSVLKQISELQKIFKGKGCKIAI